MTTNNRPKYKALWLAEKQRADVLQHKLKRWEALTPALVERGMEVVQRLQQEKRRAELKGKICLGHKVTRLDFEAFALVMSSHIRVSSPYEGDFDFGFVRMSFEGVPIGLIK